MSYGLLFRSGEDEEENDSEDEVKPDNAPEDKAE